MTDTNDPTGTLRGDGDDDDSTKPLWETRHTPGPSLVGQTIGRYRITAIIGKGGMGVVYEAQQEHPNRPVALKVINPGITSASLLRRFEHEAQILGLLQHSGIAQIFEAGTFDLGAGVQPFFAMEYVRGEPLTQYAQRHNLSTHERLQLVVKICRALQHAHQKGIIHRDLKPGNILVTDDGEPKVLDFGVARATDADIQTTTQRTDIGQLIGTIPYMSPEQAGGDPNELDTRSDVYALGVVAYELLAGRLPYDLREKMVHEAVRVIREEDPTPLSSTNRTLRGDVEIVIGKALEKEKDRRYQSALEFASDIERYLCDEPIVARPPSAAYQFRKFARRNKALVGGVAAVFIVLLVGLIVASTLYVQAEEARAEAIVARDAEAGQRRIAEQREAEATAAREAEAEQRRIAEQREAEALAAREAEAEQRRIAEEREAEAVAAREEAEAATEAEAERAEQLELVAEFQESQLTEIDTEWMGINLRLGLIDKRREFLERRGFDEEQIEANLRELDRSLTGVNFTNIALDTLDENIFMRALKTIDEKFADQPLIKSRLLHTVAATLRELGLLHRATDPQSEAIDIRRRLLGSKHPDTLDSLHQMGTLLWLQGEYTESEEYYRFAVDGYRNVLGGEHVDTLRAIHDLSYLLWTRRMYDEAEAYGREGLETCRRVFGNEHEITLYFVNNMGGLLQAQDRNLEAKPYVREALETRRHLFGDRDTSTLTSIANMGVILLQLGQHVEAENHLRKALEGWRHVAGNEHPQTITTLIWLAIASAQQGNQSAAENYYRESLAISRHVLGSEHRYTLTTMSGLISILEQQGNYGEAMAHSREVLEIRRRTLGDDDPVTLASTNNVGLLLLQMGRLSEAENYLRQTLEGRRRVLGDDHAETLNSINNLGVLLRQQGKLAEAEPYYREALETRRRVLGEDHPDTLQSINGMGALLHAQGKYAEAEPYLREALETHRRLLGKDHPETFRSFNNLGSVLEQQGRFADAEVHYRAALEGNRRVLGDEHPETLISINNVGALLREQGKLFEAEALGAEAVAAAKRALPEAHWHTAVFLGHHARTLAAMERFAEAEERHLEAHGIFEAALGAQHDRTIANIKALADLYDTWHEAEPDTGHDAKAAEWRAKLAALNGEHNDEPAEAAAADASDNGES